LVQAQPKSLFVFRNVISSHVQTQPSLRYALTLAHLQDKSDPLNRLSIIDLANLAGVKTWWLSNQQPLRGSLTAIAKQADHEYYVSNDHHGIANTLDEALVPKLKQALAESGEHKLIVLHLMGSHLQYGNRYPATFDHFQDAPPRPYQTQLSSRQQRNINQYDNSVRYTDYVLGEVMKQLPQDQSAGVVFFSDHGEEVYDTTDFKGHGPESITSSMFEIPVLVWLNQQAQADHSDWVTGLQQAEHNPAMLDHIDQLIGKLLGLTYSDHQPRYTLGDPAWQTHQRSVYGKDYDQQIRDAVK
jgi:heptose-I-phosphate ethanolaminephosphotransferase